MSWIRKALRISRDEGRSRRVPRRSPRRRRAAAGRGRRSPRRCAAAPRTPTRSIGPPGSGKARDRAGVRRRAARESARPTDTGEQARRRALADPSPHPDLAWIRPPGNQHLVEEVRERVIAQVPYRPFEGERRVFVIEAADAMAEESQNALLKTLEEPPALRAPDPRLGRAGGAAGDRPQPLPRDLPSAAAAASRPAAPAPSLRRAAGDDRGARRARRRRPRPGPLPRRASRRPPRAISPRPAARAARRRRRLGRPWTEVLEVAAENGKGEAESVATPRPSARGRTVRQGPRRRPDQARRRRRREARRAARADRRDRRRRWRSTAAWFVDLIAVAEGAPELVRNLDRSAALAERRDRRRPGRPPAARPSWRWRRGGG